MRQNLLYLIIFGLITFFSCKKDETRVSVNNNNITAPTIISTLDGRSMVITDSNKDSTMSFHWTAADYGFKTPLTYYVQLDTAGDNFKKPINIGSVTNTDSLSISLNDLNKLLIGNGYKGNIKAAIEIRVLVSLTNITNTTQLSNTASSTTVSMNITPLLVAVYPKLVWVVGDFEGWNNSNTAPALAVIDSMLGTYEGYVNVTSNNGMKFTTDHSWDNAHTFGDDGTNTATANAGKLSNVNGGKDVKLKDGIGFIKFNLDLKKLTYTTLITTWGIIGNATPGGWSTDTPMSYDAVNNVWTVTVNLVAETPPNDGWKFRANGAWDINYGDTGADKTLEAGGTNIGVSETGSYTITLNLSKSPYTYKMVKN
jgi:hypothetical protein